VTVIQRANSDLRLNPHLHTIFLDGVYSPDSDGKGQMFHPAPAPTQDEVEALAGRVSARNLTEPVDGFLRGAKYLIHDRDPLFS